MSELELSRRQYFEVEKLGLGAYLPLHGFMVEDEFHSVQDNLRLPGGDVFPLPVFLDLTADQEKTIRGSRSVSLLFDSLEVAVLYPESVFSFDKTTAALKTFGTEDQRHPGVAQLLQMGDRFVGGRVRLVQRSKLDVSCFELTPAESRSLFTKRGWRTVAGFQTRNIPHRAHEYLHRFALEQIDGLFIQPMVGWKRAGDFTAAAIMSGYRVLIEGFYPSERVVLGALSMAMRYAGPREALFHAIVRRNYGCTHFIVGRDHAGVDGFYRDYEAHDLCRRFEGELGIEILRLHGPYYCKICDGIVTERTCPHSELGSGAIKQINGSDIRAILLQGMQPDPDLIRPEVIASVREAPLFIEDDDL